MRGRRNARRGQQRQTWAQTMGALDTLIDGHTHSQFSWDAREGAMADSCRAAADRGLGGIAFTEHADMTDLTVPPGTPVDPHWRTYLDPDGRTLRLPEIDVEPYLDAVQECRRRHPELAILSGVELSEPHWHPAQVAALLHGDRFDRVISSVHAVTGDEGPCEVAMWFGQRPADEVMRAYLEEVLRMVQAGDVAILAHIDFAARFWPGDAGPFDSARFEPEHRRALAALAQSGGALEINTRRPLDPRVVAWWAQEGGRAVTFGSDSHAPATVGAGLAQAAAVAADAGFQPGGRPADPWIRPSRSG
jgi:histidinol-phosphatase (PHP family)